MHLVADNESSHDLVDLAHAYGARARTDHRIFVDLFRNGQLPWV